MTRTNKTPRLPALADGLPRNMIRRVVCSGTSHEIGLQHGTQAKDEIHGSLAFYTEYYQRKANMDWSRASEIAEKFLPMLEKDWPQYVEEMKGIAIGSDLPFLTILAMNIRTEISMGLASDGCTSFCWHTKEKTVLAQNWDWEAPQLPNLIHLTITHPHPQPTPLPTLTLITEAGLIGKIGLSSHGLGVCLNAILSPTVCYTRLPVHLALRAVLDSPSREEAIQLLEKVGVAAAANIFVADRTGGTCVEVSSRDVVRIEMETTGGPDDGAGRLVHSNHFLAPHAEGVVDLQFGGGDTLQRVVRARELLGKVRGTPSVEVVEGLLADEEGWPGSINREVSEKSRNRTLFGVVMDLEEGVGWVRLGRANDGGERVELRPVRRE